MSYRLLSLSEMFQLSGSNGSRLLSTGIVGGTGQRSQNGMLLLKGFICNGPAAGTVLTVRTHATRAVTVLERVGNCGERTGIVIRRGLSLPQNSSAILFPLTKIIARDKGGYSNFGHKPRSPSKWTVLLAWVLAGGFVGCWVDWK
jgi:hypothetical protein